MRIAFYAPLKAPDHPVPSGDRQMARQLMAALRLAGHEVDLVSRLHARSATPTLEALAALQAAADAEAAGLAQRWAAQTHARPDLWFTYHPYYKSPDLLGPRLAASLNIPYATAEASHAGKRDRDAWGAWQRPVIEALRQGAVHFCLTPVDREGLATLLGDAGRLVDLPPFVDAALFAPPAPRAYATGAPVNLVTAAMMRPGKKVRSYRFLAQALGCLADVDWRLTVVGDGEARAQVSAAFASLEPRRLRWLGERPRAEIAATFHAAELFVWPGFDEDYGMVFLEAQAAGLPVVALASCGVARAVEDGTTGTLVAEPSPDHFAQAIRVLAADPSRRRQMAAAALEFAGQERSLQRAAAILDAGLHAAVARRDRSLGHAVV